MASEIKDNTADFYVQLILIGCGPAEPAAVPPPCELLNVGPLMAP